ncbi:MAG: N-acetyl-gamma-glutamyl-phosphate reductase [Campylobacterales bacterium]
MKKIPVAVIGASGYTGLELIKLLIAHPVFEIAFLGTTEGGEEVASMHPSLLKVYNAPVEKTDLGEVAKRAELVFLAVPHQSAMALAKPLLAKGLKVVDLSADYRLKRETYEAAYCPHTDPENLGHAVYGLPELHREALKKARLVANPGCYPTAAVLGLLPFAGAIDEKSPVIVDAKSGVSGAGKKCVETTHFVTVNDNAFIYNPLTHRHAPEMAEKLGIASGKSHEIIFVPHLLPITRGMLASVYVRLKTPLENPEAIARDFYAGNPFVRVRKEPVTMKAVAGTHFCDLFVRQKGDTLLIGTAIDNLLRGASSAAVANANLMSGLDEGLGLPLVAYVP